MMRFVKFLVATLSLLPLVFLGQSGDKKQWFDFNGYQKFMQTISIAPDTTIFVDNLWHNRFNSNLYISGKSILVTQLRTRLLYGDFVKNVPEYGELINDYDGAVDLEWLLADNEDLVLSVIADRLYYQYSSTNAEFRMGRQRINWGINTTWNPNDIFNSYNIYDFDYEERQGSDAIRLKLFPNYSSAIDLAYKFTGDIKTDVAAVMYKFNKRNYDFQLIGGKYLEKVAIGGGWAGSLKLIGFKGELTYFVPYTSEGDQNMSFSTALDYSWTNGAYGMVTYLFNSTGSNEVVDPTIQTQNVPTAEYLMPAKHNVMANYSYQLSPISTINAGLIYGIGQHSFIVFPTYTINLKSNLDLDVIGQFFFQEIPEESFQNIGNGLYWRLKMSF